MRLEPEAGDTPEQWRLRANAYKAMANAYPSRPADQSYCEIQSERCNQIADQLEEAAA